MSYTNYRVYLNRHADFPFIWSVDQGSLESESKVKSVVNLGANSITMYDPSVPVGDQENPRVWIEYSKATLRIIDGIAYIEDRHDRLE